MDQLFEQAGRILENTDLKFKRFLFESIHWNSRLIGIKGARGTGKTTLVLQWLKIQKLSLQKGVYFSLDDLHFTAHSLRETVDTFYKNGGLVIVLDEVHKYKNWSIEIKNIYDFYPNLKIIFTGSSIIDISKQEADLSRRAVIYDLPGLSYREYLSMSGIIELPKIQLQDLLFKHEDLKQIIPTNFRPLEYFQSYLKYGYYPFTLKDSATSYQRIHQLIRTIVEIDMAELQGFDIRNAKKLLQLIYIIAQQVPFKPNISELAIKTGIHRNSLNNYLYYLQEAKIISLLLPAGNSTSNLQKPEKIFLNNTNLLYSLAESEIKIGSLRETFFQSQLLPVHRLNAPKKGDFLVDAKYLFEIGGQTKSQKQIKEIQNAWLVKDNIEFPLSNSLPLWMFGLLY